MSDEFTIWRADDGRVRIGGMGGDIVLSAAGAAELSQQLRPAAPREKYRVWDDAELAFIESEHAAGKTIRAIADQMGVRPQSLHAIRYRHGLTKKRAKAAR